MSGLTMDDPLTLSTIFRRAEKICQRREIVSRLADLRDAIHNDRRDR